MLAIQKVTFRTRDKKLTAIAVFTTICLENNVIKRIARQTILYTMDNNPGASCFRLKFSSANFPPKMLMIPVPSP